MTFNITVILVFVERGGCHFGPAVKRLVAKKFWKPLLYTYQILAPYVNI